MLKDLFSNRLFIGALAFFVLMIVAGTIYLRYIERQDQIELERTQERLKQWQARQKQTEKVPEGDITQGGHFHADGTWHEETHTSDQSVTSTEVPFSNKNFPLTRTEFEALPPAEQEAYKKKALKAFWAARGLDPPPPGYTYKQNQDGYHLVKYGDPLFRVTWDNFSYDNNHQLSDTEWEEYKALDVIAMGLPGTRQAEATPEIVGLAKEWHAALREKTWGPTPGLSVSTSWKGRATQEDFKRIDQMTLEKYYSLLPPPRPGTIDYIVVDRLLIELKAELERR